MHPNAHTEHNKTTKQAGYRLSLGDGAGFGRGRVARLEVAHGCHEGAADGILVGAVNLLHGQAGRNENLRHRPMRHLALQPDLWGSILHCAKLCGVIFLLA